MSLTYDKNFNYVKNISSTYLLESFDTVKSKKTESFLAYITKYLDLDEWV